jgi:hypothetical protein
MKKINVKTQKGLVALKKKAPEVVKDMGYFKLGGGTHNTFSGLPKKQIGGTSPELMPTTENKNNAVDSIKKKSLVR